jgi:hypothetical protein
MIFTTVNGINVNSLQKHILIERMKGGCFRTSDVVDAAERVGFRRADGTAQRVADHVIHQERGAGRLRMINGRWIHAGAQA